ncbi:MAG TPA: hypothetical protein PLX97_04990 [Gemmatales bacterium]|nr:hypothetical protein [Gemmatales bacterium]
MNRELLLKFVGSTFLTQIYHGLGTGITSSDATPESHIFFDFTVQLKRLGRAGRVSETLQAAQAAAALENWIGVTIVKFRIRLCHGFRLLPPEEVNRKNVNRKNVNRHENLNDA